MRSRTRRSSTQVPLPRQCQRRPPVQHRWYRHHGTGQLSPGAASHTRSSEPARRGSPVLPGSERRRLRSRSLHAIRTEHQRRLRCRVVRTITASPSRATFNWGPLADYPRTSCFEIPKRAGEKHPKYNAMAGEGSAWAILYRMAATQANAAAAIATPSVISFDRHERIDVDAV
jgi:hypothetical protein